MPVKVVVVGAGPGGMFASYLLSKHGLDVTLVEMGEDVEERMNKINGGGPDAGPNYIQGMGGSGTFSDGKINLNPEIGGNMLEFVGASDAQKLIDYVDNLFIKYGMEKESQIHPKAKDLTMRAMKAGIKFIPIKQKHIGSDFLPKIVAGIRKEMEQKGVKILTKTMATDLMVKDRKAKGVVIQRKGKEEKLDADYVV
ncbi:MAG: FAD-binding protein, partial [Candidatus ainarchaeum sp.]|nr:FAD-binding protein [Candidatus ainarchaeum sp.]